VSEVEFGRYRLIELLGRGGMGEVWRAYDTVTERVVALKVLPTQFADDAVFQERFRREARSAAGLDEPHVVPIHDFGEIDGRLYVTMRLIQGRDLHGVLNEGRIDPARAVAIIDQVASALHAAHRVNLVHRDVKPSNILVSEDDFAYLIDFGIARAAGQSGLTGTSNIIGTWAYMAPERISTGHSDARADIYALACVLYECLTGRQPFGGDSLEQQIGGHLTVPPPRASDRQPDVPAELDAVIAKGMAKKPDDRYSTTRELALAARHAITDTRRQTPRTAPTLRSSTQPASPWQQPAYPSIAARQPNPPSWPPIPQSRPAEQPGAWPGQHPPPQPAPRAGSKGWLVLGVVAALVVGAAVVAAGIYIGTKNSNNSQPSTNSPPSTYSQPFTTRTTTPTSSLPSSQSTRQPPPPQVPTMSGHYIATITGGRTFTNNWNFTPCGDGCANASWGTQGPFQARLVGGQWTMDVTLDANCNDGTHVPSGFRSHLTWDSITLAGTTQDTLLPGVCPKDNRSETKNLQFRLAP
jgi:serine/threonine protein kinase